MARTPSTNIPLGFEAPEFTLPNTVTGQPVDRDDLRSDVATVIIFMCNHCPYVLHVLEEIVNVSDEYSAKGIKFAGISANDVENYPDDSPEKMKELAEKMNFTFPYLYDESQEVARAYDAACTPEFHVFDKDMRCVYRGQLDDSRPGNDLEVNGSDLRNALDNILAGKNVDPLQKPSIGCNIKWKN